MDFKVKKALFFLSLVATQGYMSVMQAHKGVTFTVQEVSRDFTENFRDNRIFPIRMCIHNGTDGALTLSPKDIVIGGADVLTSARLESQISAMATLTLFLTVAILPIGLIAGYELSKLKKLEPIIKKYSICDAPTVIESHKNLETILFAQVDAQRDEAGKIQDFVAPKVFDIIIPLKNERTSVVLQGRVVIA